MRFEVAPKSKKSGVCWESVDIRGFFLLVGMLVFCTSCQRAETAVTPTAPKPTTTVPAPTETAPPTATPSAEPAPTITPVNVDALLDEGFAFLDEGKTANAIANAEAVLAFSPNEARAHQLLGFAHRQVNNLEAALRDFTQAIALDPENVTYYIDRANINQGLENYGAALEDAAACLQIDAARAGCFAIQARVYNIQNQWEHAVEAFTQAIEHAPQEPDYYSERGISYRELGEYEAAVADHTRAIELADDVPYYLLDRAATHLVDGSPVAALEDAEACIALDEAFAPCYFHQGEALARLGQVAAAVTAYQTYLTFVEQGDCPDCQAAARRYVREAEALETVEWGDTTWTVFRGECEGRVIGDALQLSSPSICYIQSQDAGIFELERVNYAQANLRLRVHPDKAPSINLYLVTYDNENSYWESGCTILDEPVDGLAYTFCKVETGTLDGSASDPFFVEGPRVAYDTWHQVRTEIDPETAEHRFYFNGELIGRFDSGRSEELLDASFRVEIQLHSGGDGESPVSGQTKDLLFGDVRDE